MKLSPQITQINTDYKGQTRGRSRRQIFGLFDEIVENEPDYVYNIYSIVEKINQEVITWIRN
jgi:hypothetical protein